MENLKNEIKERVTSELLDITGIESSLKVEIKPLRVEEEASIIDDNIYFGEKAKACSVDEATHLEIDMTIIINNEPMCVVCDRFKTNDNVVRKATKSALSAFLSDLE